MTYNGQVCKKAEMRKDSMTDDKTRSKRGRVWTSL